MNDIMNYARFKQQAFFNKIPDNAFLNSIWFSKPFSEAIEICNLHQINELSRNLGYIFPDFWTKYTQIKTKAVNKFSETTYRYTPKYVLAFAGLSIDEQTIPIELHNVKRGYSNAFGYGDRGFSVISKYMYNIMIGDFIELLKTFPLDGFLTTNPHIERYIKQSDFDRITKLFDKLWFNPKFKTNLITNDLLRNGLNRIMSNYKFIIDYKLNKIVITSPHVIYDDREQQTKNNQ
jgi:hypothetical protein